MPAYQGSEVLRKLIRFFGSPFRYEVLGRQNLDATRPAIYVANHLRSAGPVAMILSMPIRLHPWVIGAMLDRRRAAAYLYDDFVHPVWKLGGQLGVWVAWLVSRIAIWLMRGLGSVAVERDDTRIVVTFRHSLRLLGSGESLAIYPEDGKQPADPATGLSPFNCNFVGLCDLFAREVGRPLPIYPVAVHGASRRIAVGEPLYFGGEGGRRARIAHTCNLVRDRVAALYAGLDDWHGSEQ